MLETCSNYYQDCNFLNKTLSISLRINMTSFTIIFLVTENFSLFPIYIYITNLGSY